MTVNPTCYLAGSSVRPLVPTSASSSSWTPVEWNDKHALGSSTIGSKIVFAFRGSKVGIFVWSSKGKNYAVGPGKASCSIDEGKGIVVDAWFPDDFGQSRWHLLADKMDPGDQ